MHAGKLLQVSQSDQRVVACHCLAHLSALRLTSVILTADVMKVETNRHLQLIIGNIITAMNEALKIIRIRSCRNTAELGERFD